MLKRLDLIVAALFAGYQTYKVWPQGILVSGFTCFWSFIAGLTLCYLAITFLSTKED